MLTLIEDRSAEAPALSSSKKIGEEAMVTVATARLGPDQPQK